MRGSHDNPAAVQRDLRKDPGRKEHPPFVPAAIKAGGKHSGIRTSPDSLGVNPAAQQIARVERVRPFGQIASHWKRSRFEQAPNMRAETTIARRIETRNTDSPIYKLFRNLHLPYCLRRLCLGDLQNGAIVFGSAVVAHKRTDRRPTRSVPDVAPKQNTSSNFLFEKTVIVSRKEPTFRNSPGSRFSRKE